MAVGVIRALTCRHSRQAGLGCRWTRRARLNRGPRSGTNRHRPARLNRFHGGPRPRFISMTKIPLKDPFLARRGGRDTWPKWLRSNRHRHRQILNTRRHRAISVLLRNCHRSPSQRVLLAISRRFLLSSENSIYGQISRRFLASSANSNSGQGSSVWLTLERKYLPLPSLPNKYFDFMIFRSLSITVRNLG
jgi:hypothetical protein